MEVFGFDNDLWRDKRAQLDSAISRLPTDERAELVIVGLNVAGSRMNKIMFLPGLLVVTGRHLRVWHRDVLDPDKSHGDDLAVVPVGDVDRLEIADEDGKVQVRLLDASGDRLLATGFDDEALAPVVDWFREWATSAGLAIDEGSVETLGKMAREFGESATGWVKERTSDTLDTLTLKEYREETESLLAQIVQVLTAHEAEIRRLRDREAELTEQLEELHRSDTGYVDD